MGDGKVKLGRGPFAISIAILSMYTPLMDEFTLQIHEIWPSLNPYGPSKCSGGVFERSIWNSKCSGGAFRILNAPAEHLKILMLRSGAERSIRIF